MIVGICGTGTMGRGIAVASLLAGHTVVMFDIRSEAAQSAQVAVAAELNKAVAKKKLDAEAAQQAIDNCSTADAVAGLSQCDVVIEAIAEDPVAKRSLFEAVEAVIAPTAILASNTSSIAITALAAHLVHPRRFVGLHFFNPAHIMKLVEVIKGRSTADDVVHQAFAFATSLGKTPVIAADVPGFIVNRVARNFYNEPQRIVTEQCATIEQVDGLMSSLGFKMGPFQLMDLIGVDVNLDVTTSQWSQFYNEPRFTPSLLQRQVVDAGYHGRKSGRGFYDYSSDTTT